MSQVLIHIGFPKAGSTFLGDWFHRHPDMVFKDFALAGFLNTDELMRFSAKNPDTAEKVFVIRDMRFTSPSEDDHKNLISIEKFQQSVANLLLNLFPRAKILIVTRGFESAIRAKYSQYLKEGGFIKFRKYIEINRDSRWLPFNYSFIIDLYSGLFGNDNVLVIPFELLQADQYQFLDRIEKSLGLAHFHYQPEKKNVSLTPEMMTAFRNLNRFIYVSLFIFGPLQKPFYKYYSRLLSKRKTNSWTFSIMKWLSGSCRPQDFGCFNPGELEEKFSVHAEALKSLPDFENYSNDYFFS